MNSYRTKAACGKNINLPLLCWRSCHGNYGLRARRGRKLTNQFVAMPDVRQMSVEAHFYIGEATLIWLLNNRIKYSFCCIFRTLCFSYFTYIAGICFGAIKHRRKRTLEFIERTGSLLRKWISPLAKWKNITSGTGISTTSKGETMASSLAKIVKSVSRASGQLQNLAAPASVNVAQKRNCKLFCLSLFFLCQSVVIHLEHAPADRWENNLFNWYEFSDLF